MKSLAKLLLLLILSIPSLQVNYAQAASYLIFDNKIISNKDINNYQDLYKIINNKSISKNKAIDQIISTQLVLKGAKSYNFTADYNKVQSALKTYSTNQNQKYSIIVKKGLKNLLIKEIEKNITWSIVISALSSQKYNININDAQISEMLEAMNIETSKVKYNLTQFSAIDNQQGVNSMNKLRNQIKEGGNLSNSEIPQDIDVIELGWVSSDDLDKKIVRDFSNGNKKLSKIYSLDKRIIFYKINQKDLSQQINKKDANLAIEAIERENIKNIGSEFLKKIRQDSYIEINY